MRPRTLDEYLGQEHLLAPGSVLRTIIEQDRLRSILLYGPAGTGKTSLAALIANSTSAEFVQLSAVTAGVADVRRVVEQGKERLRAVGRRTVMFIDEVHRFSKAQQDALLPGVEAGWVVFIGATTENPFFSVIGPLLSRSTLFRLEPLGDEQLAEIVRRAVDDERGLAGAVVVAGDALEAIVSRGEGDARIALNALEAAAERAAARGDQTVTAADVADAMRQRYLRYDRAGDQHYDIVSAFIKSMRASDPDAAVAWLVRMIEAGEDPRFIARRLVIFASEDIGVADHEALQVATAAGQAVELVGLPEAAINLTHATVALALAPKSNAVIRALGAAQADLERAGRGEVPAHLRDAHYPGARALGHGEGYQYPHDHPGGRVDQTVMPVGFEDRTYWEPEPDLPERRRRARGEEGER
ncbi:MAG TPA: replication-associated recombination protein A [Actinomycetota bacterium]